MLVLGQIPSAQGFPGHKQRLVLRTGRSRASTPVRFSSQALTWKLGWALQPPLKLPTFERFFFSLSEMPYESRVVSGPVSVPWAPVSEVKIQWNLEGRTQSHLQVGQCLSCGISISVSVELGFVCCDPAQLLSVSPLVPE